MKWISGAKRSFTQTCSHCVTVIFLAIAATAFGQEQVTTSLTDAAEIPPPNLKNQSELGVLHASGNAETATYNAKHSSVYKFNENSFDLNGRYFQVTADEVEKSKNWDASFRFDRGIGVRWWLFGAEKLESNPYAGFRIRYNTDLGVRHLVVGDDIWSWSAETGYRLFSEEQVVGPYRTTHNLRIGSSLEYKMADRFSALWTLEYIQNVQDQNDYRIQSEAAFSNRINRILALKVSYLAKYNNTPPPGVKTPFDRFLTTSLVAEY